MIPNALFFNTFCYFMLPHALFFNTFSASTPFSMGFHWNLLNFIDFYSFSNVCKSNPSCYEVFSFTLCMYFSLTPAADDYEQVTFVQCTSEDVHAKHFPPWDGQGELTHTDKGTLSMVRVNQHGSNRKSSIQLPTIRPDCAKDSNSHQYPFSKFQNLRNLY